MYSSFESVFDWYLRMMMMIHHPVSSSILDHHCWATQQTFYQHDWCSIWTRRLHHPTLSLTRFDQLYPLEPNTRSPMRSAIQLMRPSKRRRKWKIRLRRNGIIDVFNECNFVFHNRSSMGLLIVRAWASIQMNVSHSNIVWCTIHFLFNTNYIDIRIDILFYHIKLSHLHRCQ